MSDFKWLDVNYKLIRLCDLDNESLNEILLGLKSGKTFHLKLLVATWKDNKYIYDLSVFDKYIKEIESILKERDNESI